MAEGDVVVVTGGAGFLGQHIVRLLQEETSVSEIRVFDVRKYHNNMGHGERVPVKSIVGDLRKCADLEKAFGGVDVVFHTASIVSVALFPDYQMMEDINVDGTANVIQACVKQNVSRLIYTSTIDVTVDDTWDTYDEAVEGKPYPQRHIFEGYGGTKCRAEKLVLAADGTRLINGVGYLRALSLRAMTMYGEQDFTFVYGHLKTARDCLGTFYPFSNSGAQCVAYAGNTAWAHIVASQTLQQNHKVGGQAFFITDDTPNTSFAEATAPFLDARGYSLSKTSLPFWLVYCLVLLMQLVCILLRPIWRGPQLVTRRSLMHYKRKLTFSGKKARDFLGYRPLFTYQQSLERAAPFYKHVPL